MLFFLKITSDYPQKNPPDIYQEGGGLRWMIKRIAITFRFK